MIAIRLGLVDGGASATSRMRERSTSAPPSRSHRADARRPGERFVVGLLGVLLVGWLAACSAGPDPAFVDEAPDESVSEGVDGGDPSVSEDMGAPPAPATQQPGGPGGAADPQPPESGAPGDGAGFDGLTPLEEFQRDCEEGIHTWRDGQVDYPAELAVKLNETLDYNAAIDIREAPLPADEVIRTDGGSAASEAVFVKCTVAARLVAIGDALEVEEQSNETVGGWVLQEFAPGGVTEWSWAVTATKPVDQELRLELHPAIISDAATGDLAYSSANRASFSTEVHIEATVLQDTAYWFETNWGLIVAICAAIGTGITAFLAWLRKLRKETSALRSP